MAGVAGTSPDFEPEADKRAIVDAGRLWASGFAAALLVTVIVLLGVLVGRGLGVPRYAGDTTGTLAPGSVASYAVLWAISALLLTGALHLLMLLTTRPLPFFGAVAALLVLAAVVAPFTAAAPLSVELTGAVINLVAGAVAAALIGWLGGRALHYSVHRSRLGRA
jgi:Family of unknown function (DUF6069)